jgi:predicted glycosyltransferase
MTLDSMAYRTRPRWCRNWRDTGQVFITSEERLDDELAKYQIKVSPEKLHDLRYYASLYVGEGATMASEVAVWGTPSVYVSSLVGTMGNFIELEQKYGLMFNYNNSDKAVNNAVELIQQSNLKEEWQKKREKLLKDKTDVTAFMVWFVENYPDSFKEIKKNPNIQYRFK